uniref:Lipoprotein n=1 Tax=Rhizophora mucronata TaxID=61149 RepID=A0A2P2N2E2_RHIMU
MIEQQKIQKRRKKSSQISVLILASCSISRKKKASYKRQTH